MNSAREIRLIDHTGDRVETGPTQLGGDWPGVFIRGENAQAFATILEMFLEDMKDSAPASDTAQINRSVVQGLANLLRSCTVRPANTGG